MRAVEEARRWIGTPYVHQASRLGAGCDCLGLVRGVWRGLYGAEPEALPPYTRDWAEPGREEVLTKAAMRLLVPKPLSAAAPGDVLIFRMRAGRVAKHMGIQSACGATPMFIHSYDRCGVVETGLSRPWARRIAARFAFPAADDTHETHLKGA
ncbi:C40 family peptidase [Alphaproteobacteria bacterium KMM 3653]|uniref:C40 family peptidase n=1 Tax=Harenicola maris TaxID=2841044 RepID=A0AAP2G3D2_9RHOB|nr:C40 family peptidase [Harenicola maris]